MADHYAMLGQDPMPEPEWVLLLRTTNEAGQNFWGTGFFVQKKQKDDFYRGKFKQIKEKPMSAADIQEKMKQRDAETQELQRMRDLARNDPTGAKNQRLDAIKAAKKLQEDADSKLQGKNNWSVANDWACQDNSDPQQTAADSWKRLYLVTNDHVLRDKVTLHVYFRPRGGADFNVVTLQLPPGAPQLWRTAYVPAQGAEAIDVAVLPVAYNEGLPLPIRQHQQSVEPVVFSEVFASGFPLLSDAEAGNWNYRKPMTYSGNVAVVYEHIPQFRATMTPTWGASGSLVYAFTEADDGDLRNRGTKMLMPMGVFSHILFGQHPEYPRFDSGVRIVWKWSVVLGLILGANQQDEYLQVVIPVEANAPQ